MKTPFLAAALLSAALVSGTAYAQTNQPAPGTASTATTTTSSDKKMMLKGSWRASKLMGLDVYNQANEKLGDVNELILDTDGKVSAVIIGVGGFLGMGEHDIAVTMDKLKFLEEPVRTTSTTPPTTERRDTPTTGAATNTAAPSARATSNANDWVPDHAVMNATKEQLKAMPQFKYSDYN
jgi:sporulation protein YlmC with PRC-barrel domain